jgi:hypothetical protein
VARKPRRASKTAATRSSRSRKPRSRRAPARPYSAGDFRRIGKTGRYINLRTGKPVTRTQRDRLVLGGTYRERKAAGTLKYRRTLDIRHVITSIFGQDYPPSQTDRIIAALARGDPGTWAMMRAQVGGNKRLERSLNEFATSISPKGWRWVEQ